AKPSAEHPLGTDETGYDVLARLMSGGKISLTISFMAVFIITILGVIFGGIAGYFGGAVDTVIMRICDILMCLPGFPILLILGTILDAPEYGIDQQYKIYYLMGFLTLISWSGTARLVHGQILSLREQEYMVAAEAMGYSTGRKIFKHLIPNVMPQLIVSMTMSLGSMILYEASLSFLGMGAPAKYAAWGTMIQAATKTDILTNHFNIWGPPGLCIIIAVLGFNFVGDGLRDALDPKMRR
ncbi:MAG: ABC transporter permease, partial [Clostridia bacterium]|nr:ABC transporter permease [Clostridia bacterium]